MKTCAFIAVAAAISAFAQPARSQQRPTTSPQNPFARPQMRQPPPPPQPGPQQWGRNNQPNGPDDCPEGPPPGGGGPRRESPGGGQGPQRGPEHGQDQPDPMRRPGGPQGEDRQPGPEHAAPFKGLFQPEEVMKHQKELDLTADQTSAIMSAMKAGGNTFLELSWKQSSQQENLGQILKSEKVDSAAAMDQFGKMLSLEDEMKRSRFKCLIDVKNVLTPQQQQKLSELDKQNVPPPQPGKYADPTQVGPPPPPPPGQTQPGENPRQPRPGNRGVDSL